MSTDVKGPRLWVALPDSLLADAREARDKVGKLGWVARTCAIFQVDTIYIYSDPFHRRPEDGDFIRLILEYMETPQYLRRQLYPRSPALGLAGTLPPLRTPHHKPFVSPQEIKVGEFRDGVVVQRGRDIYVDVGLRELVQLDGTAELGSRITVRFTSAFPALRCAPASRDSIAEYWGYSVKAAPTLAKLIHASRPRLVVMTSARGKPLADNIIHLTKRLGEADTVMLALGSPERGLDEILSREGRRPEDLAEFVLNFLPAQGVRTVRTEEALMGCLAIVNVLLHTRALPV